MLVGIIVLTSTLGGDFSRSVPMSTPAGTSSTLTEPGVSSVVEALWLKKGERKITNLMQNKSIHVRIIVICVDL